MSVASNGFRDSAFAALAQARASPYPPARTKEGLMMRFEGTPAYVADKDLMVAVNAAIALERPLLVKG